MSHLERLFFALKTKTHTRMSDYDGAMADVVFEILTADSLLAGIADTILTGHIPNRAIVPYLAHGTLSGSVWCMPDGELVDLANQPELLAHARLLDQMRLACIAATLRA
jgi:hypothetical protein